MCVPRKSVGNRHIQTSMVDRRESLGRERRLDLRADNGTRLLDRQRRVRRFIRDRDLQDLLAARVGHRQVSKSRIVQQIGSAGQEVLERRDRHTNQSINQSISEFIWCSSNKRSSLVARVLVDELLTSGTRLPEHAQCRQGIGSGLKSGRRTSAI